VAIHTKGAVVWLELLSRRFDYNSRKKESVHLFRGILSTAIALISLHVIEVFLWAILYLQLPAQAGLKGFQEAFYFSMITFTTIGYGDITLNEHWQILGGVEGMVGITVFGITTATLFAVIQWSWKLSHGKPQKANSKV
jgi:hypothetical protein